MTYPIFETVGKMLAIGGLAAWIGFCFRIGWSLHDDLPRLWQKRKKDTTL